MPELPEIEAVTRSLRPLVRGRRIRCVHILHPIATKPQSPTRLAELARGRRILDASRQGKYLLLLLDRGLIEMHFRFDGHLIWFRSASELLRRANQSPDGVHVDVAFELDKGVLGFADQRHFGRVHHWESLTMPVLPSVPSAATHFRANSRLLSCMCVSPLPAAL
jgi:formamidopyrimidine-DNA glycosylase